jgi:D-alanyl-D-alanine carboxypeptidase (penicillin-binding protein 5/6)
MDRKPKLECKRPPRRASLATVAAALAVAVAAWAGALAAGPATSAKASTAASAPVASPHIASTAPPAVRARSAIVMRRSEGGEVLWAKSPSRHLAPASCAKIMTALLVLEHFSGRLDRYLRAPAGVTAQQKVAIGLRPGDRITARQALRALIVMSANDATLTLAVGVDGSEKAFVRRMNRRAAQLGLGNTHFTNSRGQDQSGQYTCARDLAELGRYAWLKSAVFRGLVATKTAVVTWPPSHRVRVTSHNRLLNRTWGDGIKTGSTARAGRVLVGSGTPGGVPLIVVTMRESSRDREIKDAVALFRWGAAQ